MIVVKENGPAGDSSMTLFQELKCQTASESHFDVTSATQLQLKHTPYQANSSRHIS